jgi:hypothetical protein
MTASPAQSDRWTEGGYRLTVFSDGSSRPGRVGRATTDGAGLGV